jgi:hypothetical protein
MRMPVTNWLIHLTQVTSFAEHLRQIDTESPTYKTSHPQLDFQYRPN